MKITNKIVLASAFQNSQNLAVNYLNHKALRDRLHANGIEFEECIGKWHGEYELSVLFELNSLSKEHEEELGEKFKNIFFNEFNQEAILLISFDNAATLLALSGGYEKLGTWTEVCETVANKAFSSTYIVRTRKYFIVV